MRGAIRTITSGLPTIRELIGSVDSAALFILQWIGEKGWLSGGPGTKLKSPNR
jgi:hypothetical protein